MSKIYESFLTIGQEKYNGKRQHRKRGHAYSRWGEYAGGGKASGLLNKRAKAWAIIPKIARETSSLE